VVAATATGWALACAIVGIGLLMVVVVVSRRVGAEAEEDAWERRLEDATREARWLDGVVAEGLPSAEVSERLEDVVAELRDLVASAPDPSAAERAERLADALWGLEGPRTDRARSAVRQAIEAVEYTV
jgi:hypothetical protein